jgi:hypothetical protein
MTINMSQRTEEKATEDETARRAREATQARDQERKGETGDRVLSYMSLVVDLPYRKVSQGPNKQASKQAANKQARDKNERQEHVFNSNAFTLLALALASWAGTGALSQLELHHCPPALTPPYSYIDAFISFFHAHFLVLFISSRSRLGLGLWLLDIFVSRINSYQSIFT